MPEVAEVELVARDLQAVAVGQTIRSAEVLDVSRIAPLDSLEGWNVADVLRHGKLLALSLCHGPQRCRLEFHLRMTGALTAHADIAAARTAAHARAVFEFADGRALCFSDVRRFGTLNVSHAPAFGDGMGVDLLNASCSEMDRAAARCAKSRRRVKAVMLDQRGPVAGAGNYLCDEALFASGVHPARAADSLSVADWQQLWAACLMVAQATLAAGGMTMRDYKRVDGSAGDGQSVLVCYGRAGEPCVRCATALAKTVVAGRASTYCPSCQAETSGSCGDQDVT